jgi:hypothetical protein
MKLSEEQIIIAFNQAIENETGIPGNIGPLISFDDYEVLYKSKTDETIITIFNTCIFMDDLQNQTVILGRKGNRNFDFYY